MVKLIIFALIVVIVYFTRKIWSGYIVSLFSKNKIVKVNIKSEVDSAVFAPRGTIRTFVIGIDIQELGDGTAKISLAKIKDKEV